MARGMIWVLATTLVAGTACSGEPAERPATSAQEPAASPGAGAAGAGAAGAADGEATRGSDAAASAVASSEVVYVDVRTPAEYAAGHVEGAINIPHTELASRWQELAEYRDEPVVLYCRSGRRSGIAYDILREKGFTDLENGGGLRDLEREGVPVTR